MAGEGIIIAQRYRLDNEVAAGATGRVWLAMDILLRRPVAVKMLRPEYGADAAVLGRFRAVARQAASVAHRNVAAVHDYGEGGPDGAPYVVSELVEGRSAADVLAGELARAAVIAKVIGQVADGLHAAHQSGLVHGDLKPSNILLPAGPEAERRAVVTDFGLAHAVGAIPRAGTTPGAVHGTGTVAYLAPERVSGDPGTAASDLYSLGIVAFEWLTGRPPFRGTPQQVMAAHLRRPLPALPPEVPAALAALVARLAAKDPAGRFEDAARASAAARALARDLRGGTTVFPVPVADDTLLAGTLLAGNGGPAAVTTADAALGAGEAIPALRAGQVLAHKREIAWAASALVLAGLIGWAPSAP
ncbi:MAG TPA: serine/threonine-protein kinase, partial [Trebonia sp.]|nr:serine/threonine-protein kinase [Trebonia sp.]